MAVQGLVLAQLVYLVSISQFGKDLLAGARGGWRRLLRTPLLLAGIATAVLLQLIFSQTSWMNAFFATAPLSGREWLLCALPMLPMLPVAWIGQRLDPLDGRRHP
jgi:hypothetical protein